MGKSQRTKGASGERELSGLLSDALGIVVKRNLGQAREGGDDITIGKFRIECKRRKEIAVHKFMEQALASCQPGELAIVAMRGDGKPWCVMMELEDFIPMLRDAL